MTTVTDCPQSTAGQWSFYLFGVLVTVKPWFWIAALLLGATEQLGALLTWVAVCFVSILLHEFGHVLACRFFGEDAEIVLYGWGGLAIPRRSFSGTLPRFVVALAGPVAGFCLGALAIAVAVALGGRLHVYWHVLLPAIAVSPAHAADSASRWYMLVNDLLWVNLYWGLVNLLPVHPLDGGHASCAVFERSDPSRGRRRSLILSAVVAAAVALFGLLEHSTYMVLMFAVLAASSLQSLDSVRPQSRPYRSWR